MSLRLPSVISTTAGRNGRPSSRSFIALLARRRSIRRLQGGPFPAAIRDRILEAATLTPAAYNQPPWHVVVLDERRDAFWALVERAFYDQLAGERLERYLARLEGFRDGVGVLLVYEDRASVDAMQDAWQIGYDEARAFADQGLGMVQLALWLAIVAEGLATSLQHWQALIENRLATWLGHPRERFRLVAIMPLGYAGEEPRVAERPDRGQVVSLNAFSVAARKEASPAYPAQPL